MIHYFNPTDEYALRDFSKTLTILMRKHDISNRETVIVCIGSDRATGDSLGPIVGHLLACLLYTSDAADEILGG